MGYVPADNILLSDLSSQFRRLKHLYLHGILSDNAFKIPTHSLDSLVSLRLRYCNDSLAKTIIENVDENQLRNVRMPNLCDPIGQVSSTARCAEKLSNATCTLNLTVTSSADLELLTQSSLQFAQKIKLGIFDCTKDMIRRLLKWPVFLAAKEINLDLYDTNEDYSALVFGAPFAELHHLEIYFDTHIGIEGRCAAKRTGTLRLDAFL